MTNLEISKALALAIGWREDQIHKNLFIDVLQVTVRDNGEWAVMQAFDYRDWNVIGPIAAKFDCFPRWNGASWESVGLTDRLCVCQHPQKAIAMAVIQEAKK